jgi:MFS family permease
MRDDSEPGLLSVPCLGWSLLFFLSITTFSCFVASVPFIQVEWSLTNTEASIVFSSYLIGYAISALVYVPLSDRFRPGFMFLAGVAGICIPNLLFPIVAEDAWTGSGLRALAGAGQALAYTTGMRLVASRFTARRGTAVSVFIALAYLGSTLSYVLMGQLLDMWQDWRSAYFALAVFSSLSIVLTGVLLLALRQYPEPSKPVSNTTTGRLQPALLRDASIAKLIAAYAIHTADLYVVRMWLPLLLGSALVFHGTAPGAAAAQASTLAGLMFILGAGSVLAGGWLSDNWDRRKGAVLILGLSAAVSGTIGWLTGEPLYYIVGAGFLLGLLTAADSAIYSTALIEMAPEGRIGAVQALQSFVGFTAGAVMPVIAGWLIDLVDGPGKWGIAFTFNALLSVAALVFMASLRSEDKTRTATES